MYDNSDSSRSRRAFFFSFSFPDNLQLRQLTTFRADQDIVHSRLSPATAPR